MTDLSNFRVAVLATDGFEESELIEPRRALEEAGAIVTIVGVDDRALQKIRGKRGLDEGQSVKAEELVADVTADDFDALLIPGGQSPDHIRTNKDVQRFVKAASQDGFFLAIEADDPKFDIERTRAFLQSAGAREVNDVEE